MKRFTSTLLLIAMLTSLAACGSGADETQTTDPVTTSGETTTAADDGYESDDLPSDLKFGGETIHILYRGREDVANYDLLGQENSGDIVFDAVYNRNVKVEERLDVKFEYTAGPAGWSDANKFFTTTLMSGAEGVDLIWTSGNTLVANGHNASFRDLNDSEYLNFEKPWWNYDAMKEMSLDGKTISFLYGNLMLIGLRQTGLMYFNKNLFTDFWGDPNELYQLVLDGKWTLDKFNGYCKGIYSDLNGNGKADEDADRFAFMISSNDQESITHFEYATDISTYKRDKDNVPVIDMSDDRSMTIALRFCDIISKTNTDICFAAHTFDDTSLYDAFAEGRTLFLPQRFYAATISQLRNMKDEYGMIPYPKFDDEQKEYTNLIHNSGTMAGVPIAVSDERFDMVTAALEALASEQHRSVMPAFYELALKTKYSRDEISSQVIDLVYNCSTKDLAGEYAAVSNYFYALLAQCIYNDQPYASTYASKIESANTALRSLYESCVE